jgi:alpha-tubulin suppressor-like RCC1 family protein
LPTDAWLAEEAVGVSRDGAVTQVMLAGGGAHTCARTAQGQVACWGRNKYGELGLAGGDRWTPTLVPALTDIAAVAAAGGGGTGVSGHSCAIDTSGTVSCWGTNDWGQLGNGTIIPTLSSMPGRATPAAVTGLAGAVEVVAGMSHSCARKKDGTVWCWGRGDSGQLGTGNMQYQPAPVSVLGIADAVQIAAGADHTCARRIGGAISCWGRNAYGEVGTGDTLWAPVPVQVAGIPPAISVAAGNSVTCIVTAEGAAFCWGTDEFGQLGDGAGGHGIMSTAPLLLAGLRDVKKIGLGGASGCALLTSGKVMCWGSNAVGQLGRNDPSRALSPIEVTGVDAVVDLAVGSTNTCFVLRADGTLLSWGGNGNGQLGDGTAIDRWQPTAVLPLPTL